MLCQEVLTQPPGGLAKGQRASQGTLFITQKAPQNSGTHLEQASRPQAQYPSAAGMPSSAWQMNRDGKKETCNSARLLRYLALPGQTTSVVPHHSPLKRASLSFIRHPWALAISLALLEAQWTVPNDFYMVVELEQLPASGVSVSQVRGKVRRGEEPAILT